MRAATSCRCASGRIDYCPPVDLTFGEYLRAIITADVDLNPDDEFGYRVAFVESFREWGIYPRGMRSMSIEGADVADWRQVIEDGGKPVLAKDYGGRSAGLRT